MRRRDNIDDEVCKSGNETLISQSSQQQTNISGPQNYSSINNIESNNQKIQIVSVSVAPTTEPQQLTATVSRGHKRQYTNSSYIGKLNKMLDVSKFIEQVEKYIDMPINNMTGFPKEKSLPGKAKHDLFSVEDIWNSPAERKAEISTLFNTESVGERKWLLDLLTEESDPDSGGEEEFTDEDIKTMLKIHRERRKFQKKYHSDPLNLQYTYYGAGLISEHDRFPEHQNNVVKRMNLTQK